MTKRRKLVLESIILTCGFFITQFIDVSLRYWFIFGLGILTYFLTAIFLKSDLKKIGWLVVLPPVCLYVIFFSLFNFLLPQNIFLKLVIIILFWIGVYAVLLTQNIYSIASNFKTIQLIRAAQAVGFFITLVTAFLAYNTIFSFKSYSWINSLLVLVVSFPLIFSSLWSILLEEVLSGRLISYSFILSMLMAQVAAFITFWPLSITTISLFLVSFLYVILGIVQSYFSGKLFKNTLREFLQVGIAIFIITYFLSQWR